jgi:hypothetical protein
MDFDDLAVFEAACLEVQRIPYKIVFVWEDGVMVGTKVVAQEREKDGKTG